LGAIGVTPITSLNLEFGIRLDIALDLNQSSSIADSLIKVTAELNISLSGVPVIFDAGSACDISKSQILIQAISNFKSQSNGAIVYFASGFFPTAFSSIGTGFGEHPRLDKALWISIQNNIPDVGFADYTIVSPDWKKSGGGGAVPTLLRYTYDEYWVIGRDRGPDVSYSLADLLVNVRQEYKGNTYSWADGVWWERSEADLTVAKNKRSIGPGNATFHIAEAIQHHIMFVMKDDFGIVL
jgi:hypothetical protein